MQLHSAVRCPPYTTCMIRTLLQLAANIPAALVGGALFTFSLLVLQIGGFMSFVVGVCGYVVAGIWIFPAGDLRAAGERKESVTSVVKDGERKLAKMRTFPPKIKTYDMRKKIVRICDAAERIFETVKNNPDDVKTVQHFSLYYLDSTLNILTTYVELSENQDYSEDIQIALQRVETALDTVQAAFERQLAHLLNHHILDLDSEIAVLEETIEIEGI